MTVKNKPTPLATAKTEVEFALDHLIKTIFFNHQSHPDTACQNTCYSDFASIFIKEADTQDRLIARTNIDENATHRTNDEFDFYTKFWLCFWQKDADGKFKYSKILWEFDQHRYFLNKTMLGNIPYIPSLEDPVRYGGPPSIAQKKYERALKKYIRLLPESDLISPTR